MDKHFYDLVLDEEQAAFRGQERCAVCRLTTNHRGWLSTFSDALEE